MRKKLHFLLLAIISVFCSGSVWGQTDVTSTYLVNPSFEYSAEGTTSIAKDLSTGGTYYGWSIPTNIGSGTSNKSIGNATTCNGMGYGVPAAASDGSFYFFNRQGWSTQAGDISQTVNLPAGKYFITVDYKAYQKGGTTSTLGFNIDDTSILSTLPFYAADVASGTWANTDPWKTVGAWFTVSEQKDVKIAIHESLVGNAARADLYLDNVRLYQWSADDEANYAAASAESPLDMTAAFVSNPYFDSNKDGWTSTTGYQNNTRATNQAGAFSGGFYENWNKSATTSGKMYYSIESGLPSGNYKITMAAFGNNASSTATGLNMYAGEALTPITSSTPAFYSVTTNVTDGSLEFGLVLGDGNTSNWIGVDNVRLEYMGNSIDLTEWNNAKDAAKAALDTYTDESYASTERTDLNNAYNVADPTTASDLTTKLTTLTTATAAFTTAYAKDKLNAEKTDYVSNYTTLKSTYTEILETSFSGNWDAITGQHWSGESSTSYADKWSGSALTATNSTTINLPAGNYAFVAAGRGQVGSTVYLSVKIGENEAITYNYPTNSDQGLGIDTEGAASYDWRNGTFANNNAGRGWEWGYVEFTLTEPSSVTLSYNADIKNTWASFTDATLLCDVATKTAAELGAAKAVLKSALDAHPALTHVSTTAFDYNYEAGITYNNTLTTAQGVYENPTATKSEVEAQTTAVNALEIPAINAPLATQAYKIILKYDGWGWNDCAMTSRAGDRKDGGNYNIQYNAQNDNYAQAMFFTQVEGGYNISWTDADGATRYLCTGIPYGGNNYQIRSTTSASDAMLITLSRNGDYIQLYNVAASQYIGSQDAGVYTVNSHTDFAIEETTAENTISRTVDAGKFSTICLPYATTISSGKAYTAAVNGEYVTLTETTDLAASMAYILGEGTYNFSGVNIAFKEPTASTGLNGVFSNTEVPVGSYVLQTKTEGQNFYKVLEGSQPTLSANKAYLTTSSEAKSLSIGFADDATAINAVGAVNSLLNGDAMIYDLNGRQLPALKKGINIVNGVKVIVK